MWCLQGHGRDQIFHYIGDNDTDFDPVNGEHSRIRVELYLTLGVVKIPWLRQWVEMENFLYTGDDNNLIYYPLSLALNYVY